MSLIGTTMTLRLPLSLPRMTIQSQLQLQLQLLPPLRRKQQSPLRRRLLPRRTSPPTLLLPLRPKLKRHPAQSPTRMVMKLLPRPTPRSPPKLPHSLQVSARPTSRRRRKSAPSGLCASVFRLTRPRTRPKRRSAHSASVSKPAPFPRAWTRLSLSAVLSAAGMVTMVKATKRDAVWILGMADAVVRIKTTRAELVAEVATVAGLRDRVVAEAVRLRRASSMTRRRGQRPSVGLRALAAANRIWYRKAYCPTTAR